MIFEFIVIIALVVGLFYGFRPIKTTIKLERFKALLVVPIVLVPLFLKHGADKPSWFVISLSAILCIYAFWTTYQNFKSKKNE